MSNAKLFPFLFVLSIFELTWILVSFNSRGYTSSINAKTIQLLDKIYDCGPAIYYMSYPVTIYYIGNPKDEPADYAEKVLGTPSLPYTR